MGVYVVRGLQERRAWHTKVNWTELRAIATSGCINGEFPEAKTMREWSERRGVRIIACGRQKPRVKSIIQVQSIDHLVRIPQDPEYFRDRQGSPPRP